MGAHFYLMERVEGIILRAGHAKTVALEPQIWRSLGEKLVDNLATLHQLDIEKTVLQSLGKPEGYVDRQVEGWIGRYEKSQTDDIEAMQIAAEWMRQNKPQPQAPAFLHNDYKFDNVVFNQDLTEILAVLDWEMSTVGDPLMDLGACLAYWSEASDGVFAKNFNLTWLEGNLSRQELVARYAHQTGRDVSDIVFYYVFGLYKNAVIAQQIYARWKAGATQDPRFGALIFGVKEFAEMAQKAIQTGNI
jgi:aminoglycoside phosphotransferase (APT) family kinase protein